MVEIKTNKEALAIVVVGYNKEFGLKRLLNTLNEAVYPCDDIPLVISIDCSGNQRVYDIANEFIWSHGDKIVNIENTRLGLKQHIFQCASLSQYFKGVIVLEDDLMVSPYFYYYSIEALNAYGEDNNVAAIALYTPEQNGFVGLPFNPVHNGYDAFAWQTVCSWGEIWNQRMWFDFLEWLDKWDQDFSLIDMPKVIKSWDRAWSKYYYAYLISTNKYFLFPYVALTTNFNDAGGEHGGGNMSIVQVSLLQGEKNYSFGKFEQLQKYDVYWHNMEICNWLGLDANVVDVDYYCNREDYTKDYVLTPRKLPFHCVKSYALSMRPWELNVKYDISGSDIYLYKTNRDFKDIKSYLQKRNSPTETFFDYYFYRFRRQLPVKILLTKHIQRIIEAIKNRIRR